MKAQYTRTPPVTVEVGEYEKFKILTERNNESVSSAIRNMITIYIIKGKMPAGGTSIEKPNKKNSHKEKKIDIKSLPFSEFMFHSKVKGIDSTNYKEYLYGKYSKYANH